jgi:beta-lactam-binding protein with PASTA domain
VGLSRESAESRLDREGLTVQVQTQESDRPEDEVIAQSPAPGTRLDSGDRVTITISTGRQPQVQQVAVPDVEGLPERDALRMLRAEGLTGTVRERKTADEGEDGIVIVQRPGAGARTEPGQNVVIVVGRFEEPEEPAPITPPAAGQ